MAGGVPSSVGSIGGWGKAPLVVVLEALNDSKEWGPVLEKVGIIVHASVVKELSKPGSGATYRSRRGGGALHQASAPGEPPAVDLGDYRGSWKWEVLKDERAVAIYTSEVRGPALEFGTSVMAPRPHIRPATERVKGQVRDTIAKNLTAIEERTAAKTAEQAVTFTILTG